MVFDDALLIVLVHIGIVDYAGNADEGQEVVVLYCHVVLDEMAGIEVCFHFDKVVVANAVRQLHA